MSFVNFAISVASSPLEAAVYGEGILLVGIGVLAAGDLAAGVVLLPDEVDALVEVIPFPVAQS